MCRFFVVQVDGAVLLGRPDIKLLDILKITCEVMGDQQADRKFDSQTIQQSNNPSCKTNKTQQIRADNENADNVNSNMLDCFRSSTNRAADKGQARNLNNKYTMNLVILFQELGVLKNIYFTAQKGKLAIAATLRRVTYVLQEPLKDELERPQRQQIIVPLAMDETLEWCIALSWCLRLMVKYDCT